MIDVPIISQDCKYNPAFEKFCFYLGFRKLVNLKGESLNTGKTVSVVLVNTKVNVILVKCYFQNYESMELKHHIFIGLATFGLGLLYFGYTNYLRLAFKLLFY